MGEQTFPTWGKPVQQMQETGVLVVAQVARVARDHSALPDTHSTSVPSTTRVT